MKTDRMIGAALQAKRKEQNIKQEIAAKELHISRSKLSKIENGNIKISLAIVAAYCQVLAVSIQDIL